MAEGKEKFNKLIISAGILNLLGLIFILVALIKLTPITLIFSITFGGLLLLLAVIVYLYVVIQELRIRGVL
jgi:hypothetical protein